MTAELKEIWRFPIKAHGREQLHKVSLTVGQALPFDRHWAVAHEASKADGSAWVPCNQFSRAAKAPGLQAISTRFDETTGIMVLSHPDLPDLTFDPDTEGQDLVSWAGHFVPENRPQSVRVVKAQGPGFTDSDFPSVTIGNMSSHRAVSQRVGQELSIHRWRCNLWLDGLAPWEEFDWIDKEVQIGEAVFAVREPTTRCLATHANPDTGKRDADVLGALKSWDHQDFTIMTEVVRSGVIQPGDSVKVL